jgi:hypothetical protein
MSASVFQQIVAAWTAVAASPAKAERSARLPDDGRR